MIAKFDRDIDLAAFRANFKPLKIRAKDSKFDGFEWNMKKTTFYNQVTIFTRDQYSNKSIKLFPNGSVQVAGCSDLLDCRRIARVVDFIVNQTIVSEVPNHLSLSTISVKMINTNFSLNCAVALNRVIQQFSQSANFLVTFDPDRYSAVKIKFCPEPGMKRVTASIFSTGKIIVTGAQTLKEIALAFKILNENLGQHVRLGVSEKKDSFDVILGHKFEEWLPILQAKGVKAW
jgi:TATA-box binding protein (TBP) (component of TFIID and TFIIIB)